MKPIYLEQGWPYVASLIALGVWFYVLGAPFPKNPDPLMGASGTVASVLVGFLATAKAVVLSITSSRVFKALKDAGYHTVLFSYLYQAVIGGLCLLIVSIVGFFFPTNPPPEWFQVLWVLAATGAIFLYVRIAALLFKMVKQA